MNSCEQSVGVFTTSIILNSPGTALCGSWHVFCVSGASNTIQCMAQECEVRAPEDFVISHVPKPALRERYQQFMFKDHVKSHPQLRFCPGPNCQVLFDYFYGWR